MEQWKLDSMADDNFEQHTEALALERQKEAEVWVAEALCIEAPLNAVHIDAQVTFTYNDGHSLTVVITGKRSDA